MVTRRTMLKVGWAAMICRLVDLRSDVADERLLQLFCDDDDASLYGMYDLRKPFQNGSLTYGTDARCMVRAELLNPVVGDERRIPPAAQVFSNLWRPSNQWVPLGDLNLVSDRVDLQGEIDCPRCGSSCTVDVPEDFPVFNDNGEVSKDGRDLVYKYGMDPDTWKIRDKNCPVCHGLQMRGQTVVEVNGSNFALQYIEKIRQLPEPRIQTYDWPSAGKHNKLKRTGQIMLIEAGPFQGVLASIAKEV